MKFPKMKKLPSGSWHMQIQVNGERYSITESTQALVRQRAKELIGKQPDKKTRMTVEQAHDEYIKSKTPFLSPSTILGYRISKNNYLRELMDKSLDKLTQQDIDSAIAADITRGISRKTIANAGCLLTTVLKTYRPQFQPKINLPPREYNEIQIPTETELSMIWHEMTSEKYRPELGVVILFASWLGLRISEILGLRFSDFDGNHVNIHTAIVRGVNGSVEKGPKSYAGYRRIKVPEEILNIIALLPRDSEDDFVIRCHRSTINRQFHTLCENLGLPQYRIHDLRHFAASEAMTLNIPNKYQMKRMGHSTEHMLQTVYQHTMRDKEDYFADVLDEHMGKLYILSKNANAGANEEKKVV